MLDMNIRGSGTGHVFPMNLVSSIVEVAFRCWPPGNLISPCLPSPRRRSPVAGVRRRRLLRQEKVSEKMLLAVFSNSEGNILVERFHGVPAEERLHWRSFLVKLGADNLKGAKNEELFVALHKSVYIVYTLLGDICIYVVGKDEYDELALAEVIFAITSCVKDVCGKAPTERLLLDNYGKVCLCLDEIVWTGMLENTDKGIIKRLIRLKPPTGI